jgi:formylglycine-generating enzyme required for sulfatase activity
MKKLAYVCHEWLGGRALSTSIAARNTHTANCLAVRIAGIVVLSFVLAAQADAQPPWAKVNKNQIAEAKRLGVPVAFTNSIGMKFVLIPAGTFTMGSRDSANEVMRRCSIPQAQAGWFVDEHPTHKVTLTRAFYIAIYELTQSQYEALFKRPPEKPDKKKRFHPCDCDEEFQGPHRPVILVSREDAKKFFQTLNKRETGQGRTYGMPTEAQWEYACRAGSTTPFSFGKTLTTDQANYNGDYAYADGKKGKNRGKTVDVGSLAPNAWGLYDMHGNVSEWCHDWHAEYVGGPETDPKGPEKGVREHIIRGGAWRSYPGACRSACRLRAHANARSQHVGFRAVCALPHPPSP